MGHLNAGGSETRSVAWGGMLPITGWAPKVTSAAGAAGLAACYRGRVKGTIMFQRTGWGSGHVFG